MKHQLVKKPKYPHECPQCKNHDVYGNEEGHFFAGMMRFDYFCEKCEIKWSAYFEYTKDVIEPLYGKQIQLT